MSHPAEQADPAPSIPAQDDSPASDLDCPTVQPTSQLPSCSTRQGADVETDRGPHFLSILDSVFSSIVDRSEKSTDKINSAYSGPEILPRRRHNALKRKRPGLIPADGTKGTGHCNNEGVLSPPYRGVTRHRRTLSWEAHIWADKRQLYLGSFSSAAHASVAHDIMALKARGADRQLNHKLEDYEHIFPLLESIEKEDLATLLRQEGRTFCKENSARRGLELLACAASLDAPCVPPAGRNNDASPEAPPTQLPKRRHCPVKVWSPAIEVHRGRAKKRVVTRQPESFDLEKYAADIQSAAEGEAEEFEVAHNLRLLAAAIAEEDICEGWVRDIWRVRVKRLLLGATRFNTWFYQIGDPSREYDSVHDVIKYIRESEAAKQGKVAELQPRIVMKGTLSYLRNSYPSPPPLQSKYDRRRLTRHIPEGHQGHDTHRHDVKSSLVYDSDCQRGADSNVTPVEAPFPGSQRPTLVPPNTFTAKPWQRIKDLTPGSFPAATMPHPRFLNGTGGGYDTRTPTGADSRAFHRAWVGSCREGAELTVPDVEQRSQRRVEELPDWMSTSWSAPHREITPAVNAVRLQLNQPRSKVRDHEMCNTGDDHACISDAGVQQLSMNGQWKVGGCLSDGGPGREVVGALEGRISSITAGVLQQMGRGQHRGQPGGHAGGQHTGQMEGRTAINVNSLLRSTIPPQGVGQSRGQMGGQRGGQQGGQMDVRSASSTTNLPRSAIPVSAGSCSLAQLCSAGRLPRHYSVVVLPHNPINSYNSWQAGTQAPFSDPQGRCSQSVQPSSRHRPAAVSTEALALSALERTSLATPMGENALAFLIDKEVRKTAKHLNLVNQYIMSELLFRDAEARCKHCIAVLVESHLAPHLAQSTFAKMQTSKTIMTSCKKVCEMAEAEERKARSKLQQLRIRINSI